MSLLNLLSKVFINISNIIRCLRNFLQISPSHGPGAQVYIYGHSDSNTSFLLNCLKLNIIRIGMECLSWPVLHDWSSDSGNSSMHFDFSEEGRWVWTLKYKFSVSLLFLPRLVQMSHRFVAKSICSQWCWTSIVSKNHICIFLRTGVDVEHTSVFTQCDVYPTVLIVIQKKKMWKSPKTNFNLLCYRFNEGFMSVNLFISKKEIWGK